MKKSDKKTSKYKGVSAVKIHGRETKWKASYSFQGVVYRIKGHFKTEDEAMEARSEALKSVNFTFSLANTKVLSNFTKYLIKTNLLPLRSDSNSILTDYLKHLHDTTNDLASERELNEKAAFEYKISKIEKRAADKQAEQMESHLKTIAAEDLRNPTKQL